MYIRCMLLYRFFYIKCLHLTGNLPSGTVDGQIIQTLDNFIPRPPNFKVVVFFQGVETGGQNKSNPTAWHITHTFFNFDIWGRGVFQSLLGVWIFCPSTVPEGSCLWDASILCRKNGIVTYIEYTSTSFLNFCFLLHHHMSSKVRWHLATFLDMDMDLGSHKNFSAMN